MKAILYKSDHTAFGETWNFDFAVFEAMMQYPEIAYATMDNGFTLMYRNRIPKKYLNPVKYSTIHRYDSRLVIY